MDIREFIGKGKENGLTASELSDLLHIPTRDIRREIERLRRSGELIVNEQDGKGYYYTEDAEELKRQLKRNTNRAMSILVQNKYLRRKIKEVEDAKQ